MADEIEDVEEPKKRGAKPLTREEIRAEVKAALADADVTEADDAWEDLADHEARIKSIEDAPKETKTSDIGDWLPSVLGLVTVVGLVMYELYRTGKLAFGRKS